MAIRISHAPISAYGRAAYQAGRGRAIERGQELALQRDRMIMEQEARNRAFGIQEAAGQRAGRTLMAGLERKGRLDAAGFGEMRAQRQTIEQNMADWETLSGSISEPEYRRGVIAIRSGKTPPYLKQQREPKAPKPMYRASDRDALFNMATEYAYAAPEAKGLEWGEPFRNQSDLIKQYKQFLMDNNYADLETQQDKNMLEFQWEEAMGADWGEEGRKRLRWDPSSREVVQAREEMRAELTSDDKSEIGQYLTQLKEEGGSKAVTEFRKKWANPANRTMMTAQLRQRYGNVR